jgi:hypothetical protein
MALNHLFNLAFPLAVRRWAVVQASLVRPASQPSNVSGGREESGPPTVLQVKKHFCMAGHCRIGLSLLAARIRRVYNLVALGGIWFIWTKL